MYPTPNSNFLDIQTKHEEQKKTHVLSVSRITQNFNVVHVLI